MKTLLELVGFKYVRVILTNALTVGDVILTLQMHRVTSDLCEI